MLNPVTPEIPFVWPEPSINEGLRVYKSIMPIEDVAKQAACIFGVVSAIDAQAIDWIEGYLGDNSKSMLRLVVSIYPTCRTGASDLKNLMLLVERYRDRADFKVFPEEDLTARSTNLLCFCAADGSATINIGPTENMGFGEKSFSHANLVMALSAAMLERCRNWFDYLWGKSGSLRPEVVASMPRLILPDGDSEAAELWESFRRQCLLEHTEQRKDPLEVSVVVNPETSEVTLVNKNGDKISSPTDDIGVPVLDRLGEDLARIYERGELVTVDRYSRIPPLEAPIKPEWFEVKQLRKAGAISAHTSFRVRPFEDDTLHKINKLLGAPADLLQRYSFSLTDGTRWIPKKAKPLLEARLNEANENAKKLIGEAVNGDVRAFLQSQRERIKKDVQEIYEHYHREKQIPENSINNIMGELEHRLGKASGNKLFPRYSYAPLSFNPALSTEWSSPWGQAFSLLKEIAQFPREILIKRAFWGEMKRIGKLWLRQWMSPEII